MSDPADLSVNDPDPFATGADALRVEGLGSVNGSRDASITAGANGTASVSSAGTRNGSSPGTPGTPVLNGTDAPADAPAEVIDLREAGTTRVRVAKDTNPFGALSKQERMRLIVRVLCEIVAYGELEETGAEPAEPEPAAPAVTVDRAASAVADPRGDVATSPPPELPVSNN